MLHIKFRGNWSTGSGERRFLNGFYHTATFTYYNDPVILRNKLTPLSIFRDLALRK